MVRPESGTTVGPAARGAGSSVRVWSTVGVTMVVYRESIGAAGAPVAGSGLAITVSSRTRSSTRT
jgi:hypothetical protein